MKTHEEGNNKFTPPDPKSPIWNFFMRLNVIIGAILFAELFLFALVVGIMIIHQAVPVGGKLWLDQFFHAALYGPAHPWEENREGLNKSMNRFLSLRYVGLKENTYIQLHGCLTNSLIRTLDQTECPSIYNNKFLSNANFRQGFDYCLRQKGFTQKFWEIELECVRDVNIPNTWDHQEALYVKWFQDKYGELLYGEKNAHLLKNRVAECAGKKKLAFLKTSGCKPYNYNASKPSEIWSNCFTIWYKNSGLKKVDRNIWQQCTDEIKGELVELLHNVVQE